MVVVRGGDWLRSRRRSTRSERGCALLIDEQQKLVGLVTKAQAFQMAEDAELDLLLAWCGVSLYENYWLFWLRVERWPVERLRW
ncbi:hypothetical protein CASFOL_022845 [Castilleja foliolosa]|uniref:CBS domain-containing protein n=1 Tax=Castilleja foliolosa TaxID=1961234 RepID=A0ABD3CUI4_9LAMI